MQHLLASGTSANIVYVGIRVNCAEIKNVDDDGEEDVESKTIKLIKHMQASFYYKLQSTMSEARPHPASASKSYHQLHTTALAFIDALAEVPDQPSRMDFERMKALCTPDFQHSWGHTYATSLNARLQGEHSFSDFAAHLAMMLPNLDTWKVNVTDITVDEVRKKVVVRASFDMSVKGAETGVENDLLWLLQMDDTGEKVKKSVEFIDSVATGKIRELIMARGPV